MPRTANSKTKDELLVEIAILKYNEQVRTMLKQELAPFSESIKEIDHRLNIVETEVSEIKDVIAPFSAIRKRLWFTVIAISLIVGLLTTEFINWVRSIVK